MSGAKGVEVLDKLQKYFQEFKNFDSLKLDEADKFDVKYSGKSHVFEKKTQTAFKIHSSRDDKKFYTLDSIVFYLHNQSKSRGTYIKDAAAKGVQAVKYNDAKILLKLLKGKLALKDCKSVILSSTKEGHSSKKSKKRASSRNAPEAKREKLIGFWERNEQALSTMDSILRCKLDIGNMIRPIVHEFKLRQENKIPQNNPSSETKKKPVAKFLQPIIIVPATSTATVTLSNVKQFLEQGKWVPPSSSSVLKSEVGIDRKVKGIVSKFRVVNNPNRLEDEEWDRVVAVFVQGQKWQFRTWSKFKGEADLFDKVLGIFVQFEGEKKNESVKAWNVRTLKISRQRRNADLIQSHRIWEEIDRFITNKKPFLLQH